MQVINKDSKLLPTYVEMVLLSRALLLVAVMNITKITWVLKAINTGVVFLSAMMFFILKVLMPLLLAESEDPYPPA